MDVLIAKNFEKKIIKTNGIFALTMFGYNYCWQCANEDNSCNKCCHSTNMQIFCGATKGLSSSCEKI